MVNKARKISLLIIIKDNTKDRVRKAKFFKKKSDRLTCYIFTMLLSYNNVFVSKAFLVSGDVYLALFALRSL